MLHRLRSLRTLTSELNGMYTSFILHTLKNEHVSHCGPAYSDYDNAFFTLSLPRLIAMHEESQRSFGEGFLNPPIHHQMLSLDAPPTVPANRHCNRLIAIKASRNDHYMYSVIPTIVHALNLLKHC